MADARCFYKSSIPPETIAACEEVERRRQSLVRGEATPETLAYARFLNAVENDATLSRGGFKAFKHDDDEVVRDWPFLKALIHPQQGHETPPERTDDD